MNIQDMNRYPPKTVPLDEYTTDTLDDTIGEGAVESARYTALNTARALGKLINVLADKGDLDLENVMHILNRDLAIIKECNPGEHDYSQRHCQKCGTLVSPEELKI